MQHDEIIALIRAAHRERCFHMEQRKRLDLALGSFLRLMLGWRKDAPEAERKRIAAVVAQMMNEGGGKWAEIIADSRKASAIFEVREEACRKRMAKLAVQLPVWQSFGAEVRGFGEVSLAVIIAEAGDLSDYDSDSKLWKRMGLAAGQNRVPPNLSKEQRAEAWIDRGYNPRRRSHMWNIGDALIKGNREGVYRTLYLKRKEYEHARDPEMSKMHAHRRAQKYMEKRLLRDLWRAWRRANAHVAERPTHVLPAAPIPGEGQSRLVRQDHAASADARSPMPEGQKRDVREDQIVAADGLPIASGEGHVRSVRKDHPAPALPARGYKIRTSMVKASHGLTERSRDFLPSP